MATPSKRAADANPMDGPWFSPLGRRPKRREEPAAPLEVLEASDGTVTIITPNQT